jgi:hypothetical protein
VISPEAAVGIARAECERRGWPITAEVVVESRAFRHVVHAPLRDHGGCVVVRVGRRTGRVVAFRPSVECHRSPDGIVRTVRPCPHGMAGPEGARVRRVR